MTKNGDRNFVQCKGWFWSTIDVQQYQQLPQAKNYLRLGINNSDIQAIPGMEYDYTISDNVNFTNRLNHLKIVSNELPLQEQILNLVFIVWLTMSIAISHEEQAL